MTVKREVFEVAVVDRDAVIDRIIAARCGRERLLAGARKPNWQLRASPA